ncbi:alpha/beta fold hydrolase [Chitinophaga sp. CB10]|uniref:alpha/beta hydrolase family protein n=1 Tax=Chitinophaga sp. CB10 TaxID=1891659 RepID=UPI0025BBE0D1|nr:alpha/beta fold hydrolase [Chitinophaga sp. CB10]
MKKGIVCALLAWLCMNKANAQASREVYFNNEDSIRFAGTLTMPAGKAKVPAVILLSGTGKQDRDGTMAGHKMFKALADSLVALGVAVLRTDDRGTGKTNGVYETATTEDFAMDALAAVRFLKAQPRIDNVGLLGHSEGGAAAIIAAASSKDVAFLVTLAGLAVSGVDALKYQNNALIEAAPISPYDKNRHRTITTRMFDTVYAYACTEKLEARLRSTYAAWKHADDSAYAADKAGQEDHMRFFLESYITHATGRWYQWHIRYAPEKYLQQIKVPVLALNGDKDIMVPAGPNLSNIKNTLHAAGNYHVQTKVLPGLNHLFLKCNSCTNQELPQLQGDFDPAAWQVIREWFETIIISKLS